MGKNKLERWAEMEGFPHVIQDSRAELMKTPHAIQGKWNSDFFKNEHPIVLELGCGKGEYTVGLARRFPNKNFIGIDVKGARIWRGAKTVLEEKISNAGFIRTRIDFIAAFFSPGEVSEIWLTFSDPQPRPQWEKKRLTSPWFLERYTRLLGKDGIIHVKSDSDFLYEYTREVIRRYQLKCIVDTSDLYGDDFNSFDAETKDILDIRTFYEEMWLSKGKKIKYLKFILPADFKRRDDIIIEMDPALAALEEYYKTVDGIKTR